MIILALDISSVSTGFSIFENSKLLDYGIIDTSKIKMHGERLLFFETALKDLFLKYKPDLLGAEDIYKGRNPKTHKILALYHGIAYKIGYEFLKDDPAVLYAGEIRSIIGDRHQIKLKKKGVKDKELTFDFIKELFQFNEFQFKKHNDITDAVAIGLALSYMIEDSEDGSLRHIRGCARSQQKRRKKSVSKTGSQVSSRSKSK